MSDVEDAGFDDFLDAVEADSAYFLSCPVDHGSLPPRHVCPTCGDSDLERTPLPETGTIETYTVTHVATPSFVDDAPYVTAIADFGPVRLTGQLVADGDGGNGEPHAGHGDDDLESIDAGTPVTLAVSKSETTGERLVAFHPIDQ